MGLHSLTVLNLSDNQVTYINQNHTADLAQLEHVDLSANSIEYVFAGAFARSPHIRSINLKGNSLDCSCVLHGFANLLKHGKFPEETLSSALCDNGSRIVDFDFEAVGCTTAGISTTKALPFETTGLALSTSTTIVSTTTTSEMDSVMLSTSQHTTAAPFIGRLTIVHVEQDDKKLSLTWNAYSASDPLDQLRCLLTVYIVEEKSWTNLTVPCPPSARNKTFHIFVAKPGLKHEVCLLAFRKTVEVARSCSIFNTSEAKPTTPVLPTTTGGSLTTLPYEKTTAFTFAESSVVTTDTAVQTSTQKKEDSDFRYRLRFHTNTSVPHELRVRWYFLPPFPTKSGCHFNVTVLKNKGMLTQTEAACYSDGQLMVADIAKNNDYDVCFSQLVLDIPADCHEISFAKPVYSSEVTVGAASAGNRERSSTPVALLVMIAALAVIAVLAIVLFIHRRLRRRAMARRKTGDSMFHLQINRRSGTYMVQDATEARTTQSTSVSQDGTKMSQRASSVDEL
ncbi:hypothetical protein V5799_027227 [Amblyomma americanum]|uniref:Uncharacterized protein n=1 Tax=Amblyomma americanum TaxID=6943 RepID=A0AAQ4DGB6_AMBAM